MDGNDGYVLSKCKTLVGKRGEQEIIILLSVHPTATMQSFRDQGWGDTF